MVMALVKKVFGTQNDRELKRSAKLVEKVNAFEPDYEAKSDDELKALTEQFRERLAGGERLDDLLPEAFAAVREASKRTLGLRHFDVQLIGGVVLHEGNIAEMRTGEGKTLVSTLASYLNALPDTGVHLITVNDYLARRDAHWMGPIFSALGMSVGVVQSSGALGPDNASFLYDPEFDGNIPNFKHLRVVTRKEAYAADITYGTNNEFGFDYLRDNMVLHADQRSQRGLAYAIVDEVDSILIDEARTPLIISGMAEDSSKLYVEFNKIVPLLKFQPPVDERALESPDQDEDFDEETIGDFTIDEKANSVELTEEGHQKVEDILVKRGLIAEDDSLYASQNLNMLHHVQSALKAHNLFKRDVEYIIQDGQVVLIDQHTGRKMPGRRLGDGLHQAIEAKEGVAIQHESQTMASTTFQNYFRLYNKLSGMTGTADTEAVEFNEIYGLKVVVIPTNRKIARVDHNDLIYLSVDEKFEAVVEYIREIVAKGAPVLVGTVSIENSERMSQILVKAGIDHQVLNAKFHEKEAQIVAQAGIPGAVTIATNMAGRGTDIVLGGNLEVELNEMGDASEAEIQQAREAWEKRQQQVMEAGGLHIIGTERHESRRIDNQLRGRAGRQGDPGESRFFLSMEDNLMRLFASDRVRGMMQAIGMERGEAIEHRMVTSSIEKAQRKVEGRNFDMRKQLLEYDDVANDQRLVVYKQRNDLLDTEDVSDIVAAMRQDVVSQMVDENMPPQSVEEQWTLENLDADFEKDLGLKIESAKWVAEDKALDSNGLNERLLGLVTESYQAKVAHLPDDVARRLERDLMLQIMDKLWKEHLATMDLLRAGIGLRGYAGRNPKQEYKRESFQLFSELLENVKYDVDVLDNLCRLAVDQSFNRITVDGDTSTNDAAILAATHRASNALIDDLQSAEGQLFAEAVTQILIAKRPQHLHKGGLWEFPGGKISAEETVAIALARELWEELGIEVDPAQAEYLFAIHWSYPEKDVRLEICLVDAFDGEPTGKEGQMVRWVAVDELGDYEFPEANAEIVRWLSDQV
eukprot:g4468.t1